MKWIRFSARFLSIVIIITGCSSTQVRQDESVVRQSTDAFLEGDWERAEDAARVALDIRPYNAQAAYILAMVFENTDRVPDALDMYRLIVSTNTQAVVPPELSQKAVQDGRLFDIAQERITTLEAAAQASGDKDEDGDGVADKVDRCVATPPGARVDALGCWTLTNLFEPGKTAVRPESLPLLDEVAAVLKRSPQLILEVQGHTDSSGSEAFNRQLSEQRANEVAKYLRGKGIASARLLPKGYGASRPKASNETEAGKAQNRRIEFVARKR